jgi:MFS family permease
MKILCIVALLALVCTNMSSARHLHSASRSTAKSTKASARQQVVGEKTASVEASVKKSSVVAGLPSLQLTDTQRGIMAIIGGFFTHLTLGTVYCWGNFNSYAPQNMKFFDGIFKSGVPADSLKVLPLTIAAQCVGIPMGPSVIKKIGAQKTLLLGCWIAAGSIFMASFQTNLKDFIKFYSLLFGFGVGLAYTAPMAAGFKCLPNSKGLVSGGVLAGFGLGGFFFNMIGSSLVNPKGINPVGGVFPDEIYEGFPNMLRKLSLIYAAVSTLGAMLVTEAPVPEGTTDPSQFLPGVTVEYALTTPQLWMLWMMILTGASAGLNVAGVYKSFAGTSAALNGDGYLSLVGGIGAILNGTGRLFWGIISDKFGVKNSWICLVIFQSLVGLLYPYSVNSKGTFLLGTSAAYFCLAGTFALMPPACQKIFGPANGATIYGIAMSAFGVAAVSGNLFTTVSFVPCNYSPKCNIIPVYICIFFFHLTYLTYRRVTELIPTIYVSPKNADAGAEHGMEACVLPLLGHVPHGRPHRHWPQTAQGRACLLGAVNQCELGCAVPQ